MNIKEKLQAILAAANTTTGETDTTLTDAVQSLIDGYGGGGGLPDGIAEVATGTYTPAYKDVGATPIISGTRPNTRAFLVEHGMNGVPDGYVVVPSVWYDTQDSQLLCAAYFKGMARMCVGRRSAASGTQWAGYDFLTTLADGGAANYANETYINLFGGGYAQFCPTWIDGNGNTGAQAYKWIAWRWS